MVALDGMDGERLGRLLGIKLRALVAEHLGTPVGVEATGFSGGAGLVLDGAAWVLVDGASSSTAGSALGPALAWAVRHRATSLDLIADVDTGMLARRASGFDVPINVWFAEERMLFPVVAEPFIEPARATDGHLAMIPMIENAGADPIVERGVVAGEVRGLEVCRVVAEPTLGRLIEIGEIDIETISPDAVSGVILEVGVGATDREAFQLLHGDIPKPEALAGVVDAVRRHRTADAPQHPLNRMAKERFLRWEVTQQPERVAMTSLIAAEPPVPRPSMKRAAPCVSIGIDESGDEHVIVFSAGVDLDLVPYAVDAATFLALTHDVVDRITIVIRDADLLAITRQIAALATRPIDFVTI